MTEQTRIFSTNLNKLLNESKKTQIEVANAIGVSQQTFNTWCRGVALPRMDKIQKIANFFNVGKDYLIEEHLPDYDVIIKKSEPGDPIIVEVVQIAQEMTEKQKRRLARIAKVIKEEEGD